MKNFSLLIALSLVLSAFQIGAFASDKSTKSKTEKTGIEGPGGAKVPQAESNHDEESSPAPSPSPSPTEKSKKSED